MKHILSGILIIFLATGLVAGVTYLISQSMSFPAAGGPGEGGGFGGRGGGADFNADGATLQSPPQDGAQGDTGSGGTRPGGAPGTSDSSLTQGDFKGGRGGKLEGGSAAGWVQVLKNLGIIALVTAGVVAVQKVSEAIRRPRKLAGATSVP